MPDTAFERPGPLARRHIADTHRSAFLSTQSATAAIPSRAALLVLNAALIQRIRTLKIALDRQTGEAGSQPRLRLSLAAFAVSSPRASVLRLADGQLPATNDDSIAPPAIAGLTPRQAQVLHLFLAGQPSKNIAADLGISQRTVENHRAAIMRRSGATSLPALTRMAVGWSKAGDCR